MSGVRVHSRKLVAQDPVDQQPEEPHAKVNDEHTTSVLFVETFANKTTCRNTRSAQTRTAGSLDGVCVRVRVYACVSVQVQPRARVPSSLQGGGGAGPRGFEANAHRVCCRIPSSFRRMDKTRRYTPGKAALRKPERRQNRKRPSGGGKRPLRPMRRDLGS
jgi:hypothetical protein